MERWKVADAAQVAGIDAPKLRVWKQRGHVWFDEEGDMKPEKDGMPHLLTFASVMKVVILGRLVHLGLRPDRAWLVASAFTDAGDWSFDIIPETTRPRGPAELYANGRTILCARADGVGEMMNVADDEQLSAILKDRSDPVIAIDLNRLTQTVRTDLLRLASK